jgi:hypothetical protein
MRKTTFERFLAKYKVVKGHWIWQKNKTQGGYGVFKFAQKDTTAHRASYLFFVGEIPPSMHVLHICDTPSCINPAHLFIGTPADNMRDMVLKGRNTNSGINSSSATKCPKGHSYTLDNTYVYVRKNEYLSAKYSDKLTRTNRICRECARLRSAKIRKLRKDKL